jgi:hypothetical protein
VIKEGWKKPFYIFSQFFVVYITHGTHRKERKKFFSTFFGVKPAERTVCCQYMHSMIVISYILYGHQMNKKKYRDRMISFRALSSRPPIMCVIQCLEHNVFSLYSYL